MSILRIMTFNLRVNSAKDGVNAWPARADRAAALIAAHRPDIIGFQEMQPIHWDDFVTRLPAYGRCAGPKVDNQEPWAYPAIFWNVHRLHLLARGGFYLSETPDTFSRSWDSAYTRGATWAQLRLNDFSVNPLLVVNTHLDNKGETARRQQAAVLLARTDKLQHPHHAAVLTGDFNCDETAPAHATLTAGGFHDTFLETAHAPDAVSATFHNYTGVPNRRIDWILVRPGVLQVTTLACEVLTDAEPPLYPSDHFPVLATLRLEHVEKRNIPR